ncbi:serine/threonine protein kinase [Coemansia spiralis]|uniref:non-specific serine/threonine protein kinase n=2 Tax=Coemansia TaxID=4863 RepID=A0A9W8G4T7_9FUNG|nr:serine/threonine protein kinase [Coemansia umbellata]KAJ2618689.1 serine/threonine protein kinase [Coemansia sp. RSA 1358]KAJ2674176.1 serine/threonine protein kinase [Coemansia spiralis]
MGVLSASHKKAEADHHPAPYQHQHQHQHQHHHHLSDLLLHHHHESHHSSDAQHTAAIANTTDASQNNDSASAVNGTPAQSKPARYTSLKIRTDSANQPMASLPQQSMSAGAKPPSPYRSIHNNNSHSQAPAPTAAAAATPKQPPTSGSPASSNPIAIKRTTSFSQRLHNLLHRDKSQKNPQSTTAAAAVSGPVQALRQGALGHETPTIAYRTPTTQTHSTDVSANVSGAASTNNSPPTSLSPRDSSNNLAKEGGATMSAAYHAQRNFEPVPEDKVFAISNVGLRSVERHSSQIRQSMSKNHSHASDQTVPQATADKKQQQQTSVDDMAHELQHASIEPAITNTESHGASAHSMSREPSQNTLNYNQAAGDVHDTKPSAAAKSSAIHYSAAGPAAASSAVPTIEQEKLKQTAAHNRRHSNGPALTGVTVGSGRPSVDDIADIRERLAAGTTRDPVTQPAEDTDAGDATCTHAAKPEDVCPSTPQKKPAPVYSSHKATLNQFGKQTKVIGKGTGGTVRLLQGAEVDRRPPSLRSGPPSSHQGDEPNIYVPSKHRLFAVKEFRKRRHDETPRAYMKKVTSEFCIGSSVHQENVIETLDLIFEGDRVYEIMEYCPYDLFTFVAMGSMDLEETFCWFKQVCQGVQYLHKIGIAHRDLKLENCLLTERGIVKIIDFGCATVFKTPFQKEPSKVVGVCGSDPYIAPEVLMSRRQLPYYAQIADIWSVGIMYMCMTLLKFPWRIADTETDRNYGSYIRDWPRGREKLFAQLPKLRHDGQQTIEGMVYPETKDRLTMNQVMESEWMKEIDVCRTGFPAKSHTHHMKTDSDE